MERTWIVVCDASHCRFFMKRTGSSEWVKFEEFEHPASRVKGMDLASDRPGRTLQSQAPNKRAATEPRTNPHLVELQRFARYITDTLERAHNQNAFDRFVLVAPPGFLGELRSSMPEQLKKALYGTLDKDYSWMDDSEVIQRVELP